MAEIPSPNASGVHRMDLVVSGGGGSPKFSSFFVDNVEFYHDQGGLTLGKAALTDSIKKNICGKTTRELVPGTLQVYYMKGYGAVEMGIHRFHHPGA